MTAIWTIAAALIGVSALATFIVVGRQALKRYLSKNVLKQATELRAILHRLHQSNFEGIDKMLFDMRDTYDLRVIESEFHNVLTEKKMKSPVHLLAAFDQLGITEQYLQLLRHAPAWRERARIAAALGTLGVPKAVPLLLEAMRDPKEDGDVKLASAEALGQIKNPEIIPALCEELGNTDEWASPRLAQVLTQFGSLSVGPLIDTVENASSLNARIWATQILGKIGDSDAVATLLKRLHDRSEQMRMSVSAALGDIGDNRAMRPLIEIILRDPVAAVRAQSAAALGRIGDESALPLLVNALGDPEYWVRFRALEAIESLNIPDARPIEQALSDTAPEVRKRAALALERLGVLESDFRRLVDDDDAIYQDARERLISMGRAGLSERLARHLDEDNPRMRERIASLLGPVGDIHHANFLCDRLIDPVLTVRLAIIQSLGDLAVEVTAIKLVPLLADSESQIRQATVDALRRFDQRALKTILNDLESMADRDNDQVRLAAFQVLSTIKTPEVNELLQLAVGDRFVEIRIQAVRALGERKLTESIPPIRGLLTDSHATLRLAAADALGKIGGDEAIAALLGVIEQADNEQRDSICDTISANGFDAIVPVLDLLMAKPDQNSRLAIAWTLGKTGDERAAPLLATLLEESDQSIRASAAGALGKLKCPVASKALAEACFDPNPRVRSAAINGLARIGNTEHLSIALQLLSDPDPFVRNRSVLAIARLPGDDRFDLIHAAPPQTINKAHQIIASALTDDLRGISLAIDAVQDETMVADIHSILEREDDVLQQRFYSALTPNKDPQHIRNKTKTSIEADEVVRNFLNTARNHQQSDVRQHALSVLSHAQHPDIPKTMVSVLASDPDAQCRRTAVAALSHYIESPSVQIALLDALIDPDLEVRPIAITLVQRFARPVKSMAFLILCVAKIQQHAKQQ